MIKKILILFVIILIYFILQKNKQEHFTLNYNYDNVNYFKLLNKRYLFFDIFARNDQLIIISPVYDDLDINYDNIEIFIDDKKLKLLEKHDYIEYEPCVIRIYDIKNLRVKNNELLTATVKYNDKQQSFLLEYKILTKKHNLVLSTLFKDDDYLLPTWLNYYDNQGVNYFYMYINKKSDRNYKFKNCKFIEWDFHYWNKYNKEKIKYNHHAQLGQINHSIYKYGKPLSKWIGNIDLDEYIYVKNKQINQILNTEHNLIIFKNYFSSLKDNYIPKDKILNLYKIPIFKSKTFSKSPSRTKFLSQTDNIICNGIHNTKKMINKKINNSLNNQMIHFQNWTKGTRREFKDYEIIYL